MPYFRWSGIDLQGDVCKGKNFARTKTELARSLLSRDIGLLSAEQLSSWTAGSVISHGLKIKTLAHLAFLLKAQIHLYQALSIVAATLKHVYFQQVIEDVAQQLARGESLSASFALHPQVFDELTITLTAVGQETGCLAEVMDLLAVHGQQMQEFKHAIKSALTVPLVTFGFFFALVITIFTVIVPRFAVFFASFQEPLPSATLFIISLSDRFCDGSLLLVMIVLVLSCFCFYRYAKTRKGRHTVDLVVLQIPFFSYCLKEFYRAHFFRILGLLLQGGVHITNALSLAGSSFNSGLLEQIIQIVAHDVAAGKTLSASLAEHKIFSCIELNALITVGESSGELGLMVKHAGELYQKKVYDRIRRLTHFIQPAFLLILGILIAGLIIALYLPIFTLSAVIA